MLLGDGVWMVNLEYWVGEEEMGMEDVYCVVKRLVQLRFEKVDGIGLLEWIARATDRDLQCEG